MDNMETQSYRDLLKREYLQKKTKNPRYSIRSFSRSLGLSSAYISYLFSKKRHLSVKAGLTISNKLKWNAAEQKYFLSLIKLEKSNCEADRELALQQLQRLKASSLKFELYEIDKFLLATDWHYSAILSLLTIDGSWSTMSIAQKLSLPLSDAKNALISLMRLGLVKKEKHIWIAVNNYLRVESAPSAAIRKYHKYFLSTAAKAIDEQSFEERNFSNLTLTVDVSKMPLVQKMIENFQSELTQALAGQNQTEVYQFSTQLFRLTQKSRDQ